VGRIGKYDVFAQSDQEEFPWGNKVNIRMHVMSSISIIHFIDLRLLLGNFHINQSLLSCSVYTRMLKRHFVALSCCTITRILRQLSIDCTACRRPRKSSPRSARKLLETSKLLASGFRLPLSVKNFEFNTSFTQLNSPPGYPLASQPCQPFQYRDMKSRLEAVRQGSPKCVPHSYHIL
jgi:hypothetical protein